MARRPEVRDRLCAAVSEADRVVVLGDLLEEGELAVPVRAYP